MPISYRDLKNTAESVKTVTHSAGTYTLDLSSVEKNFSLDISGSYFDTASTATPAQATPVYVGGKTAANVGITTTWSTVLTDLTGGIASAPAAGDIVIVGYGISGTSDIDVTMSTVGYAELFDLYANDTNDAQGALYYKVMSEPADTSVVLGQTGSTSNAGAVVIHVWRNIEVSSPIDGVATTATGTNASNIDAPAITTTLYNDIVIAFGAGTGDTTAGTLTQTGLSNFITVGSSDTESVTVGMGSYLASSPTAYNAAAWTMSNTTTSDSWISGAVAIRALSNSPAITIDVSNIPASLKDTFNVYAQNAASIVQGGTSSRIVPIQWSSSFLPANKTTVTYLQQSKTFSDGFTTIAGQIYPKVT